MTASAASTPPSSSLPGIDREDIPHLIQFYESNASLVDGVARFASGALGVGDGALIIATSQHRDQIKAALANGIFDLHQAISSNLLVFLDARETLAKFLIGGEPDPSLFFKHLEDVLNRMGATRRVRVYGEMVVLLHQDGRRETALKLEELWNKLATKHRATLFRAFPISGFAEEVAKRRAAETARALLAAIVDSSDDAIISKSLDGIVTSWNTGATRIFGYTADEMIGRHISTLFPPGRIAEEDQIIARIRSGQRIDHFQTVRLRKDGTPVDVSLTISPVHDSSGKLIGASKIARDMTEHKRTEQQLRQERELLGAIIDKIPVMITLYEPDTKVLRLNPEFQRVVGWSTSDCAGASLMEQCYPDPDYRRRVSEFMASCRDGWMDIRMRTRGGYDIDTLWANIRLASGAQVGIGIDITQRNYAERALVKEQEKQNQRLRLLNEAAVHLLAAEDESEMVRGLFTSVRQHLGLDCCVNYAIDDASNALSLLSCIGMTAEKMADPISAAVAQERRFIAVTSIQNSNDLRVAALKQQGLGCYVSNPLLAGHRLLGTLAFGSRSKIAFADDELEFIRMLCHYVAEAFERVRLFKQLREADRRKDEFLATLAHELRNPLAPIQTSLELLQRQLPEAADGEQLRGIMQRQVKQLTRLVDELLEVSRITSGKISLRRELVDIAAVIQNAVDTSMPQIERAGHKLTVLLPPQQITVDADSVRLAQVFANLLNNAAKYTDPGGAIHLSLKRSHTQAIVSVRDNGVGILPEMLPRVFDMFAQIDRTLNRAQGGLGIGLALAKKLVILHGGYIEAQSEGSGKGSEFIVRIPVAPRTAGAGDDSGAAQSAPAAQRRRILIADDNRDAAMSLSMLLQTFHHATRVAFDGVQAIEMAEEFKPDVVLLDIGMPRMDGYEVARKIRDANWSAGTKLVALTGWGQEEDRRKTRDAGFHHHFTKPIDLKALVELLASHQPA